MRGLVRPTAGLVCLQPGLLIAALGLMAVTPPHSLAQAVGNDWIGRRVVQKYADFELKNGEQVIDPKTIEIYRVEQVDGPSLRLEAPQLSGWAPADQVVLVEQAIEYFTDSVRLDPGDAFAYGMRAIVWLMEKKDLDKALADLNEAIRLDPADAWAYCNRGNVWHDKKEYDKAIADFNEAIRLDPNDVFGLQQPRASPGTTRRSTTRPSPTSTRPSGSIRKTLPPTTTAASPGTTRGNTTRPSPTYNEAIRLDPKDATAYNNRGSAWSDKREYDKAIADYNEAIRLDPEVRLCLQQPRHRLARQEGIRQGHRRLQRGHPARSARRHRLQQPRASPGSDKKEYDKAIADFNEAIRLDPKIRLGLQQPRHRLARQEGIRQGHRRLQRGHPARPERRCRLQQPRATPGATKRNTTRPSPTTPRPSGSIRKTPVPTTTAATPGTHKKEYDKAIADYTEAIRLDPRNAERLRNRGIAWRSKKEYDKAIADYNEAIRLDPEYALAYNHRGMAWSDKKEYDKAIADYNEAIRLDPKYALRLQQPRLALGDLPRRQIPRRQEGRPVGDEGVRAVGVEGPATRWTPSPRPMPRRVTSSRPLSGNPRRSSS